MRNFAKCFLGGLLIFSGVLAHAEQTMLESFKKEITATRETINTEEEKAGYDSEKLKGNQPYEDAKRRLQDLKDSERQYRKETGQEETPTMRWGVRCGADCPGR